MDWVFGAVNGRAVQSQIFGTECWNFGTVLDSPGMDFWDCFRTVR